jgi:hypothetical protein
MTEELKPCPWDKLGQHAVEIDDGYDEYGLYYYSYVKCQDCLAQGPHCEMTAGEAEKIYDFDYDKIYKLLRDSARAAWNKRVSYD